MSAGGRIRWSRVKPRFALLGFVVVSACSFTLPSEEDVFGGKGSSLEEVDSSSGGDDGSSSGGADSSGSGGDDSSLGGDGSSLGGDDGSSSGGRESNGSGGEPEVDSCENSFLDGDESDMDCGGSCERCDDGASCNSDSDCTSKVCSLGTCAKPLCGDGVKNGMESDVDCGGLCQQCRIGQDCGSVADCDVILNDDLVSTQCVAGTCALLCPEGMDGCSTFQMVDHEVVIEAEHMDGGRPEPDTSHAWTEFTDGSVTGVVCGPDQGGTWQTEEIVSTTSPRADYRVNFTSMGTFRFWIRATGPDWAADSMQAGVDNEFPFPYFILSSNNTYGWQDASFTIDSVGVHVIHLWGREDGARVDKIVINRSSTAPIGEGPAESARN